MITGPLYLAPFLLLSFGLSGWNSLKAEERHADQLLSKIEKTIGVDLFVQKAFSKYDFERFAGDYSKEFSDLPLADLIKSVSLEMAQNRGEDLKFIVDRSALGKPSAFVVLLGIMSLGARDGLFSDLSLDVKVALIASFKKNSGNRWVILYLIERYVAEVLHGKISDEKSLEFKDFLYFLLSGKPEDDYLMRFQIDRLVEVAKGVGDKGEPKGPDHSESVNPQ